MLGYFLGGGGGLCCCHSTAVVATATAAFVTAATVAAVLEPRDIDLGGSGGGGGDPDLEGTAGGGKPIPLTLAGFGGRGGGIALWGGMLEGGGPKAGLEVAGYNGKVRGILMGSDSDDAEATNAVGVDDGVDGPDGDDRKTGDMRGESRSPKTATAEAPLWLPPPISESAWDDVEVDLPVRSGGRGWGWFLPGRFFGFVPGERRFRPFHLGLPSCYRKKAVATYHETY